MEFNSRIQWIDTARGILIILVVIGHIAFFASAFVKTNLYGFVGCLNFLLLPYYMPAFFIITGFVSNFQQSFTIFLKKNFFSLVIPNLLIGFFLNNWIRMFLADGISVSNFMNLDYLHFLFTGGSWFLSALFLSKLFYWFFNKYLKKKCIINWGFVLSVFIVGVLFYNFKWPNLWYYQHALMLMPFLYIGEFLRCHLHILNYRKTIFFVGGVFILTMFLCQYFGIKYPYINSIPFLPLESCLLVILFSIVGTLTIFALSQFFHNHNWLIEIGRHSLTIYLLHGGIAIFFLKQSLNILGSERALLVRVLSAASVITITIFICVTVDRLINTYFPFMKGKIKKFEL